MRKLRLFGKRAGIICAAIGLAVVLSSPRTALAARSEPQKLDTNVNCVGSNHFPFVTADGQRLYWCANAFPEGHGLNEDIYVSVWDSSAGDWGPRQQLGDEINTLARELSPCESPDRQYLWFTRYNGAMFYDLFYCVWDTVNGKWGTAVNAGPQFNSECVEWSVSISPDGKRMFLVHGIRPGTIGCEGEVLWVSYWNDSLQWWDSLIWMGDVINNAASSFSASMSLDTSRLYIASGSVWPGIVKYGIRDLFVFSYNPLAWDTVQNVGMPPNSDGREETVALSPDGRFLYFSSNRDTTKPGPDIFVSERSVSVEDAENEAIPEAFELSAPWPNPFNASVSVGVDVAASGWLNLGVYDLLGRRVSRLSDARTGPGVHRFTWPARDAPSGVYFLVAKMGDVRQVRKLLLLK